MNPDGWQAKLGEFLFAHSWDLSLLNIGLVFAAGRWSKGGPRKAWDKVRVHFGYEPIRKAAK